MKREVVSLSRLAISRLPVDFLPSIGLRLLFMCYFFWALEVAELISATYCHSSASSAHSCKQGEVSLSRFAPQSVGSHLFTRGSLWSSSCVVQSEVLGVHLSPPLGLGDFGDIQVVRSAVLNPLGSDLDLAGEVRASQSRWQQG